MSIREFIFNPKNLIEKIIDILHILILKNNFLRKKIIFLYNVMIGKSWTS
jgi:hypothetical protein